MEAWKNFLELTKVEDVLEPNFKLISVKNTENVIDVLNLLREKNILSVPVYDDESKRWLGLVDILDVVIDAVSHKTVDWYNFTEQELKVLQDESIETIVNASERNPWCPVSNLKPLNSLMVMLSADVNLHRVPIVDDNEEVIGIVTQAAVCQFPFILPFILGHQLSLQTFG